MSIRNKTVIEFDDNSTVAVFPPIKAVVDQLDEKWNASAIADATVRLALDS